MWLTRFSIQRPIIVSMLFIALAIYGIFAFFQIGRSLNPNVTFPIVVVSATYPGASPAEMERLVVKPIEDQIDGIDNLDQMSATAEDGLAAVVVQFKLDTNLDYAAIDVQRRVDTARVFMPTDLDPPLVDKSAGSQQAPILTLRPRLARDRPRDPPRAERAERRRQGRCEARVPRLSRPAAADRHGRDGLRHLQRDQPE
jgi:HAE1 family hydrophobic/amphiphilic exporter-1